MGKNRTKTGMDGMLSGISKVSKRLNKKISSLQTKVLEQVNGLSPDERLKAYQAVSEVYTNHLSSMGAITHQVKHRIGKE